MDGSVCTRGPQRMTHRPDIELTFYWLFDLIRSVWSLINLALDFFLAYSKISSPTCYLKWRPKRSASSWRWQLGTKQTSWTCWSVRHEMTLIHERISSTAGPWLFFLFWQYKANRTLSIQVEHWTLLRLISIDVLHNKKRRISRHETQIIWEFLFV